jgi:hypothetical protein
MMTATNKGGKTGTSSGTQQPGSNGDGIDPNQGPLEPLMKKVEATTPPSTQQGGDGVDTGQGPLEPLAKKSKATPPPAKKAHGKGSKH